MNEFKQLFNTISEFHIKYIVKLNFILYINNLYKQLNISQIKNMSVNSIRYKKAKKNKKARIVISLYLESYDSISNSNISRPITIYDNFEIHEKGKMISVKDQQNIMRLISSAIKHDWSLDWLEWLEKRKTKLDGNQYILF